MKKVFTLKDLTLFTQIEKDLCNEIFNEEMVKPKKSTVNSILNYSKALSVKKSQTISNIEMVLN